MDSGTENQVVFFGCPLDPDERAESIQEKHGIASGGGLPLTDPFQVVMAFIREEMADRNWADLGSLPVPDWLTPAPGDLSRIRTEEFVSFLDDDGCRRAAGDVERFVSERILPRIPCMVGVDHSLTAGAFKAVSDHYGKDNLSLIVLDSHTDAVPMSALADAIQYDIDTNPASPHDRNDPFLYDRVDSVNASSFIHHLLVEEIVLSENLFLVGVGDYPEKRAFRVKDPRIAGYVGVYKKMKQDGAAILTKKDCASSPKKLKTLLEKLKTPYVYISVDMDIGARNALEGVRFRDRRGLQEKQIYRIVEAIGHLLSRNVRLAGLDITEINPRRAGGMSSSGEDKTYRIAANLIETIAFGRRGIGR